MKIPSSQLRAAFEKVADLAGKTTTLPILNTVRLSAADDVLTIHGTNLECHGISVCECDGELAPVCVSARMLGELIRNAPEFITLTIGKNNRLEIVGNGKAQLSTQPVDEFPDFPNEKAVATGVNATDLADCIEAVAWAADPKLDGKESLVWVKLDEKGITAASTDRKLFGYAKRPGIASAAEFMFRATHAAKVVDALRSTAELSIAPSWIVCTSEKQSIAVRRSEGNYYRIDQLLAMERKPIGEIEIRPLLDVMSTMRLFGDAKMFAPVQLNFAKDGITVEFKNAENEYSETVACTVKGESIRIDAMKAQDLFRNTQGAKAKASVGMTSLFLENGEFITALSLIGDNKK